MKSVYDSETLSHTLCLFTELIHNISGPEVDACKWDVTCTGYTGLKG